MSNREYTRLWTENFDLEDVQRYDEKFKSRWEKHIKHQEQIAFIQKYMQDDMFWCDVPIGSGRLMQELKTEKILGYDISESFLEYNRKRGIPCDQGDLFEFGDKYQDKFDLITSLHSIFAFMDYRLILKGFVNALKPGGTLIVDITNRLHADRTQRIKAKIFENPSLYPDGMTREEIHTFFESIDCKVVEIKPHDYWDNYFFFEWRYLKGNFVEKRQKKYIWQFLNFAYFRLRLDGFFQRIETGKPEYAFTTYLVAVQKKIPETH